MDYSVRCDGDHAEKYNRYYYWTGIVGAVYALGTPTLFMYLVYAFKSRGQRGDKVVQASLGWMCTFFDLLKYYPAAAPFLLACSSCRCVATLTQKNPNPRMFLFSLCRFAVP